MSFAKFEQKFLMFLLFQMKTFSRYFVAAYASAIKKELFWKNMTIKCDKCSYRARCNARIQDHQKRIHSDQKKWKCSFPSCTFRTKGKTGLNNNQRTHEVNSEVRKESPFLLC